jgi:hypothetical protein
MDTLTAIRTHADRTQDIRTDFDDLPTPRYVQRVPKDMIREVDATAKERSDAAKARAAARPSTGYTDYANPPAQTQPIVGRPSDRQMEYMVSLMRQLRDLDGQDGTSYVAAVDYQNRMTGRWNPAKGENVSVWIDRLKAKVAELKARPAVTTPRAEGVWSTWRNLAAKLVEIGGNHGARFAVDTEDGAENPLAFWWIVKNENGANGTRYFLRQVIGGQGAVRVRMSPEAMIAIARKIETAGPLNAMLRYGQEIGECGHCGRELTNAKSRAQGIGPVCRKGKGI